MPDVYVANQAVQTTNNTWTGAWKLTRAMKKAGWRYFGSSNGVSKDTTGNPSSDLWGAQTQVSGQNGTTAALTTVAGADIIVTGLTGMTAASVGRYLRVSGAASAANNGTWQIVASISSSSVRIRNTSAVPSDANNNSIVWFEDDPALDAYPALDSVTAWWGARGPDVLKIPIGAASTGTFVRGENVTQATSNATGEILGYVFNTASDSFLVVMPRFGTFNGTNVISGGTSAATVTPNATPIVFVCEVVFWKSTNTTDGTIYHVRCDAASESASRLSSLITAAGCTATIAPGGGGTGNAFPALAYCGAGTGGSAAHTSWCQATNHGSPRFQIAVANTINDTNVSADGTFWIVMGYPTTTTNVNNGFGFMRMDDTEDGDVDPYLFVTNTTSASPTRTAMINSGNNATWSNLTYWYSTTMGGWAGWRRRGFSTGDAHSNTWATCALIPTRSLGTTTPPTGAYLSSISTTIGNYSTTDRVACHPATPIPKEPIWVINYTATTKQRKGTFRWAYWVPTGTEYDAWDSFRYIQVMGATSSQLGLILGPWDGSTTPVQS